MSMFAGLDVEAVAVVTCTPPCVPECLRCNGSQGESPERVDE